MDAPAREELSVFRLEHLMFLFLCCFYLSYVELEWKKNQLYHDVVSPNIDKRCVVRDVLPVLLRECDETQTRSSPSKSVQRRYGVDTWYAIRSWQWYTCCNDEQTGRRE